MTKNAHKLLESMRNSKSGWKQRDLVKLYTYFGFKISHAASHDIVKHPKYLHLRTTLPRHKDIAKIYIEIAVKLVDQALEYGKEENNGSSEKS